MIHVERALCGGCGTCVDACPVEAIILIDDVALVDVDRCDGCGECVEVCPNHALAWIPETVVETGSESLLPAVSQPSAKMIHFGLTKPVPWGRALFPLVGAAVSWAGRELVPRLAPLALNVLEEAIDHRLSQPTRHDRVRSIVIKHASDSGRKRRRQRRRRQGKE